MPTPAEAVSGALLDSRYRLEELLGEADGMRLWRGVDTLVGELPVAIRAWWGLPAEELTALQERLDLLKAVLHPQVCLLYTSPSPRDLSTSRMPSSA